MLHPALKWFAEGFGALSVRATKRFFVDRDYQGALDEFHAYMLYMMQLEDSGRLEDAQHAFGQMRQMAPGGFPGEGATLFGRVDDRSIASLRVEPLSF